jgi:hypothetical protein
VSVLVVSVKVLVVVVVEMAVLVVPVNALRSSRPWLPKEA